MSLASYKKLQISTSYRKMDTFCVFVIFACFFSISSAYIVSDRTTTLVKEGLSAEIFCMVEGTGDYFWRKGESFHDSTLVASSTRDNDNKDNKPYVVTVNGTLFIRKVTLKDEGKYFCRITSVENECHGEVKVIVQASLSNFFLAIDRCDRESSCLLFLNPSQSISLKCTAYNAPPLMTLKWFNGSKEITEGIEEDEILSENGNLRDITSTVTAVYGHPASLTCQAVDPKRSNDDVRFVHAQVEMTVHVNETLSTVIILAVTVAGCFIFFGIYVHIKARANRKQQKKDKEDIRKEVKILTERKRDTTMSQQEEMVKLIEIINLDDPQSNEAPKEQTDLEKKDKELKMKRGLIQVLMTEVESKITEVNEKQGEIEKLNNELGLKEKELKEARKEKSADD